MKNTMQRILVICSLFLIPSATFAVTPSNASLKGTYSFQLASSHFYSWGKQLTCSGKSVWMGGTTVKSESIVGAVTFSGTGTVSGSYTDYGQLNQTASNNTASCTSGGHAVYLAPASGTLSGTYTVASTGAGAMTIKPSTSTTSVGLVLKLAAGNATSGVRSTVFMTDLNSDQSVDVTGSAVLQ